MALTAADVLIETLQDWGVEVVFGLPGDGINGIMEVDPFEPPLPAKVTLDQATVLGDRIRELV